MLLIADIDQIAEQLTFERGDACNRAFYRAVKGRRHARAAYILEHHDERSMMRALSAEAIERGVARIEAMVARARRREPHTDT